MPMVASSLPDLGGSLRPAAQRAVLLDFGGVLAEEGFRAGLQALAHLQGLDPDALAQEGRRIIHESGYITGTGSEVAFWRLMRWRTGLEGDDGELRNAILSRFRLRPEMLEAVAALRRSRHLLALLSDQTDWLDRLDRRDRFSSAFDRVFNSYHLGKTKQDPSIFEDVAADLGLATSQFVFIDDDAGHVQRARERGMNVILCTDPHQTAALLHGLARRPPGGRQVPCRPRSTAADPGGVWRCHPDPGH